MQKLDIAFLKNCYKKSLNLGRIGFLQLPDNSREKILGKAFGQNEATMWFYCILIKIEVYQQRHMVRSNNEWLLQNISLFCKETIFQYRCCKWNMNSIPAIFITDFGTAILEHHSVALLTLSHKMKKTTTKKLLDIVSFSFHFYNWNFTF